MTARRVLLIGLGLWLLTGVYTVGVDEQAVVRRFGAVSAPETLRQASEAAVAAAVAARPVDSLLTTGRLETQVELQRRVQETADAYRLGVAVTAVNIQAVTPPLKVADAFREVA